MCLIVYNIAVFVCRFPATFSQKTSAAWRDVKKLCLVDINVTGNAVKIVQRSA